MSEQNVIRINRGLLRWLSLGIGLVALIVTVIALIVTPQNKLTTVSYVSLAVFVAGLAGFVMIDVAAFVQMFTGRTGQFGTTTTLMSIFFVAFIVALFIVIRAAEIPPIDVTESQQYSLSEASIELARNLAEPVHVIAFYADTSFQREEAESWLQQYKRYSDGKLTYEFVDPDRNPALARQYELTRTGILVFEQGDRTAQASFLSEQDLTGALARVQIGERRKVYAITGHGERSVEGFEGPDFSQAAADLRNANFTVEPLNLLESGSIPDDADLVLIAGPTGQFAASEVEALKTYLDAGGAAFLLTDPASGGGNLGNGVMGLSFSDDGKLLATAGADSTVRVWDVTSGDEVAVLHGHASDVLDVAFAPDGKTLVTAGRDNTVRVWDVASGQQTGQLEGETDLVVRVAFSPDGRLIASVGENQAVNVWDAATYQPLGYSPLTVPVPLRALAFSPDSALIAASGGSVTAAVGPVYVWNVENGEQVVSERLHTNTVLSIAFSPDGETLRSVAVDGTVGTLDVATGEGSTSPLYADLGITSLAIAPDGRLAYAVGDGSVHLREAGAGSTTDSDTVLEGHTDIVWDLAFTPDGSLLASAGRDGIVRLWDAASGSLSQELSGHSAGDPLLAYLETEWGVRVQDDIVVDLATANEFDEFTPVVFNTYNDISSITSSLLEGQRRTFFTLARSIETTGSFDPVAPTPLLTTSAGVTQVTSWGESSNPFITGTLQFDEADTPGPLALAVSAENRDTHARLVVVGDSDFASNDALSYGAYANAEFFINAADWLAGGESTVELPPPNFDQRLIDRPFSPIGLALVSIGLTCLIPMVVAVAGGSLWFSRRRRR